MSSASSIRSPCIETVTYCSSSVIAFLRSAGSMSQAPTASLRNDSRSLTLLNGSISASRCARTSTLSISRRVEHPGQLYQLGRLTSVACASCRCLGGCRRLRPGTLPRSARSRWARAVWWGRRAIRKVRLPAGAHG